MITQQERRQRGDMPLRVLAGLGALALAELLRWVYISLIYPEFYYFGYSRSPVGVFEYGLSVLLACLLAALLPVRLAQPSHYILWIVYIVAALPSMLVPHYGVAGLTEQQALALSSQVFLCFGVVLLLGRGRWGAMPRHESGVLGFWLVVGLVSAATYALMALTVGIALRAPRLTDVYDVRGDYRAVVTGAFPLGYLLAIQANVLNPLMILRGIAGRGSWRLLFLAGFAGQYVIYSGTGLKSVILSTPALLIVALLLRRRGSRLPGAVLLWGAFVAAVAAIGLDRLLSTSAWVSISIRRFLITPGLLAGAYFTIFDDLEKVWFRYGSTGALFGLENPYTTTPSYLVGRWYFGREGMNANANLFADGFANGAFAGMAVQALLLVALLRAANSAAEGLPITLAVPIFTVPAIALGNTSVLTTAITHGLVAAIVLCALAPRTGWSSPTDEQAEPEQGAPTVARPEAQAVGQ